MYDLFRPCAAVCWAGDDVPGVVLASVPDAAGRSEVTHLRLPGNLSPARTPVHDRRDFSILSTAECRSLPHLIRPILVDDAVPCVVLAGTAASGLPTLHLYSLREDGGEMLGDANAAGDRCWEVAAPPALSSLSGPRRSSVSSAAAESSSPLSSSSSRLLIETTRCGGGGGGGNALVAASQAVSGGVWLADVNRLGSVASRTASTLSAARSGDGWSTVELPEQAGGRQLAALQFSDCDPHIVHTVDRQGALGRLDLRTGRVEVPVSELAQLRLGASVTALAVKGDTALAVCANGRLLGWDLRRGGLPLVNACLGPVGVGEFEAEAPRAAPSLPLARFDVQFPTAPWDVFSVSGFADGSVRLYDVGSVGLRGGAMAGQDPTPLVQRDPARPEPVFTHRGHQVEHEACVSEAAGTSVAPAPPVVIHTWHPSGGHTILSADARGGLQAWVTAAAQVS